MPSLKRLIKSRKSITSTRRSMDSFKRKLSLKARSGFAMRSTVRNQRLSGGPAYRRKFKTKYRG
jgi:hypothetical protein